MYWYIIGIHKNRYNKSSKFTYKNENSNSSAILNCLLGLFIGLHQIQIQVFCPSAFTAHVLDTVLVFTLHTKTEIREAAPHGIISNMKVSPMMYEANVPKPLPVAAHLGEFYVQQVEDSTGTNRRTSL